MHFEILDGRNIIIVSVGRWFESSRPDFYSNKENY